MGARLFWERQKKNFKILLKNGYTTLTILGLSALDTDHPNYVGMVEHGNYGPNVLTNECDVLIAVGMRFDDRVTGRLSIMPSKPK